MLIREGSLDLKCSRVQSGSDESSPGNDLRFINVHQDCWQEYTLEDDPMDPENHWLVEENEENTLPGGQDVRVHVSFREIRSFRPPRRQFSTKPAATSRGTATFLNDSYNYCFK